MTMDEMKAAIQCVGRWAIAHTGKETVKGIGSGMHGEGSENSE